MIHLWPLRLAIHTDRAPTSTPRGKFPYKHSAVYAASWPFTNRNCGRRGPQNAQTCFRYVFLHIPVHLWYNQYVQCAEDDILCTSMINLVNNYHVKTITVHWCRVCSYCEKEMSILVTDGIELSDEQQAVYKQERYATTRSFCLFLKGPDRWIFYLFLNN